MPRSGYPSSDRPAEDLAPPPKGPVPGGRIVHEPTVTGRHECSPPEGPDSAVRRTWVSMNVLSSSGPRFIHTSEFESGTVWQCGECGTTWVSGRGRWSPEGRFARWRRERRARRRGSVPVVAPAKSVSLEQLAAAPRPPMYGPGTVVFPKVNAPPDELPPSAAIVTKGGAKPPNSPPPPRGNRKPPPPPPRKNG